MSQKVYHILDQIGEANWQKLKPAQNPFLHYQFFNALEQSHSISKDSGWEPIYIQNQEGILYSFAKTHSYGEYIFDWGWADAYARHGISYYPKLTSMIPFTPVTTSHFLMPKFDEKIASQLFKTYSELYQNSPCSSSHFLFLTQNEINFFKNQNYLIRESFQYHFYNRDYSSFDGFLGSLKKRKAKMITKERRHPRLDIELYTGDKLKQHHAQQMYRFYNSTIQKKHAHAYLTADFFKIIFDNFKENTLYIEASENEKPVAGALFFYDHEKLYGRYWGCNNEHNNLHFELCYYQGIEFCIQNNLKIFEAGAQGEHKIARGFRPVKTYSAHHLKHPNFHKAVEQFIGEETQMLDNLITRLNQSLPFKGK